MKYIPFVLWQLANTVMRMGLYSLLCIMLLAHFEPDVTFSDARTNIVTTVSVGVSSVSDLYVELTSDETN